MHLCRRWPLASTSAELSIEYGPAMRRVRIIEADLSRPDHQTAVVQLTDAYAADPMGDGRPLSPAARDALIPGLRQHPTAMIFLAFDGDDPIGIATCFRGFSTFAARPLINIHDLAVMPAHRGKGVARCLLDEVERKARDLGCCKLTLEVLENNQRARQVYAAAGFGDPVYQVSAQGSLFLSKSL